MSYEYKTVGAPEKGKRKRGARSASDRVAAAFEEILQTEARDGWEYLRTDTIPVSERKSWFGRSRVVRRAVMVFRRSSAREAVRPAARAEGEPQLRSVPLPVRDREPTLSDSPDRRLAEIVRGPGGSKPDGQ